MPQKLILKQKRRQHRPCAEQEREPEVVIVPRDCREDRVTEVLDRIAGTLENAVETAARRTL